eukprot:TRINITY_DN1563_c0_g1_i2.p1 TRINITY_DN1563_c0_g1~~TRINITY_DN1563_c0_g1_i2.p1  ORF type:complete len:334 (-),score=52.07 TRINITY_DN1563_c0_g1_i2:74-1075(-)
MDSLAELQAVLAGLPMNAIPRDRACGSRACLCGLPDGRHYGNDKTAEKQVVDGSTPLALSCAEKIEMALLQCRREFPKYREELSRLTVVYATLDVSIFADHSSKLLFTAVRGTDPNLNHLTTPRDMNNNILVFCGFAPSRVNSVLQAYKSVRHDFPTYMSYGSGHSLGGNVLQELAKRVEEDPTYGFTRVDLFNIGGSPLQSCLTPLHKTEFNVHRVPGDPISSWHRSSTRRVTVKKKPDFHPHSLGHFLPPRESADETMGETTSRLVGLCCGSRQTPPKATQSDMLQPECLEIQDYEMEGNVFEGVESEGVENESDVAAGVQSSSSSKNRAI